MKSIAQFNGERGITKWACQSCHTLIAHGYYVEGKLISVMRETHYHKKTHVCAICMPAAIQAMTLAVDKQIHVLMDPWVALPNYDPTEDQPEHVGNVEILVGCGVPKEEQERRNAARSVADVEQDIRVRDAIRAKAIELGIDVVGGTAEKESAKGYVGGGRHEPSGMLDPNKKDD